MNFLVILSLLISIFGCQWTHLLTNYNNQNLNYKKAIAPTFDIFSKPTLANEKDIFKEISAKGIVLSDMGSGAILAEKNLDQNFTIASITKLMTALVILENFDPNDIVTISYKAANVSGSNVHLYVGEQIKVSELIQGMLIASGNDAAIALGEHFGEGDLVTLMSQKAQELGMENTHFADSSGLSLENRSTPKDLTILTKAAIKHPLISKSVRAKSATLTSTDGSNQHLIHTTNRLLKHFSDITGVKTGYTEEAGFCLISTAKRGDHELLLVLLGSQSDDTRFDESRVILNRVFENITW